VLLRVRHWRRRINRVDRDLDSIIDHGGDKTCNVGRAELKAGIRIDFNEPGLQVFIKHKVIAKDFKCILAALRVQLPRARLNRISNKLLDLWQDRLHEVHLHILCVQVLLELGIRQLISILKFAIVCTSILNSVISQMDQSILHIFNVVLAA